MGLTNLAGSSTLQSKQTLIKSGSKTGHTKDLVISGTEKQMTSKAQVENR